MAQNRWVKRFSTSYQRLANKVNISGAYSEYCGEFIDMLTLFFNMCDEHLGQTKIAKNRTKQQQNSSPVHSAPYQTGPTIRVFQRFEIKKIQSRNVIKPEQTEWTASTVCVLKKNGSLSFIFDHWKLNNQYREDSCPIPTISRASTFPTTVLSKLDASSGYWHVEIDDKDQNNAITISHCGCYRFVCMTSF